jgi:hypothetical protein
LKLPWRRYARDLYWSAEAMRRFVRHEWRARRFPVPWATRLRMWSRGFYAESAALYDFAAQRRSDFLSDLAFLRSGRIDGSARQLFADKLLFERAFRALLDVPPVVARVVRGRLLAGEKRTGEAASLDELLARFPEGLVLKPRFGGGGYGVLFLRKGPEGLSLSGEPVDVPAVERTCASLADSIVVPFVRQSEWAAHFHPATTNTLRVVTCLEPETGGAFVASAVLRVGCAASSPLDNFTQGGMSCAVDLETGALGPARKKALRGAPGVHPVHPETGVAIEGERVPHWAAIRGALCAAAEQFPMAPYGGWDVIHVPPRGVVIECNPRSDVNLLQVHGPLLRDERVRRFMEHHRVL